LTKCFTDIINNYKCGPLEIVIFSMRELQWRDIKAAAYEKKQSSKDPRIWASMNDVLAVYEEEWEDADLYEYYS
jgi:hypothetical protein